MLSLRFGNRRFAPTILGTVLLLVFGAGLLKLGFWQLHRADEKRQLLAQYAEGAQQAVPFDPVSAGDLPKYREIITPQGRYDGGRQVLLDNMPSSRGEAGYQVLTPFILDGSGSVLLVDRGWIAMGTSRRALPDIAVPDRAAVVRGRLDDLPQPGVRLGQNTPAAGWPKVLTYPEYSELAALFGDRLQRRIVLLNSDEPDGYERQWQLRFGFGPERHIGYAVTWFALTLTLLIIYVIVSLESAVSSSRSTP